MQNGSFLSATLPRVAPRGKVIVSELSPKGTLFLFLNTSEKSILFSRPKKRELCLLCIVTEAHPADDEVR